jgi:hypothetical protein
MLESQRSTAGEADIILAQQEEWRIGFGKHPARRCQPVAPKSQPLGIGVENETLGMWDRGIRFGEDVNWLAETSSAEFGNSLRESAERARGGDHTD